MSVSKLAQGNFISSSCSLPKDEGYTFQGHVSIGAGSKFLLPRMRSEADIIEAGFVIFYPAGPANGMRKKHAIFFILDDRFLGGDPTPSRLLGAVDPPPPAFRAYASALLRCFYIALVLTIENVIDVDVTEQFRCRRN